MKIFETQLYSGGGKIPNSKIFPGNKTPMKRTVSDECHFYKQCGLLSLNCDQTHFIEGTEAFKVTLQDSRLPETMALMIESAHCFLNSVLSFHTPNCLWVWLFDEIYFPLSFWYWRWGKKRTKKPTTCFNCAEGNDGKFYLSLGSK